ncbi:olfactory receptor 1019-like [Xenopus tropicalis]|uniref:Olfactory receptor 1019-like n=1 Tax=Xenopus tropicalis TaxID=8364 RepID=A0A8J0QR79_XENTR|nr:olfactory receptor 1019-like [Xenopus tropicalis]
MAYDRYVAICDPLRYIARMTPKLCLTLIVASLVVSFLDPIGHVTVISKLSYCGSHVIEHFFCDVTPLLKLSCSDTFMVQLLNYIEGALVVFSFFLPILTSYIFIISAILKIQSSEGRQKAFSTCASHLSCVIIFYGTLVFLYVRPTTSYYSKRDKFFALLHIVLIPMLNPLIYTLKNKEFQSAFIKLRDRQI